jgi:hypothetical protein
MYGGAGVVVAGGAVFAIAQASIALHGLPGPRSPRVAAAVRPAVPLAASASVPLLARATPADLKASHDWESRMADRDVWIMADLLRRRGGKQAEMLAANRAQDFLVRGDIASARVWRRVEAALAWYDPSNQPAPRRKTPRPSFAGG